jgi:hypothetical protein
MLALSARIQDFQALVPSQHFQDIMITCLRQALLRAGESMKQNDSGNLKDTAEDPADLISRVGLEIRDELRTPPLPGTGSGAGDEWKYWINL